MQSNIITFGTLNVRTLGQLVEESEIKVSGVVDKLPFVVEECRRVNLEIVCLQEVRRVGKGCIERDGYTLYYSGHNTIRKEGVGILINTLLVKDVKKVGYVSSRVIWVYGCFGGMPCVIFSIYAPTNVYSTENKEQFYDELDTSLKSIPIQYRKNVIIMGDFNARIGVKSNINDAWDSARGEFGCAEDTLNENGELMLEFCVRNRLVVVNSKYRKKCYGTWKHPRSKIMHLLDYCLVAKCCFPQVVDCGVDKNIDIESDHELVKLTFRRDVKTNSNNTHEFRSKIAKSKPDFSLLLHDENLRQSLGEKMDECIIKLREEGDLSDESWFEEIAKVCVDCVPAKVKGDVQVQDWFDINRVDILAMLDNRRMLKKRRGYNKVCSDEYRESKKCVRRELRSMQSLFWKSVADDIQEKADRNDTQGYYQALKVVFGGKSGRDSNVRMKSADGVGYASCNEDRWTEHFQDLLNQKRVVGLDIDIDMFLPVQEEVIWELDEVFSERDVYEAFACMKNGKAAGKDGVTVECFNFAESELLLPEITKLWNKWLASGLIPDVCRDVIVSILFKKGDTEVCDNYRGLSLIAHHGKALERAIQNRLDSYVESVTRMWVPESQCGFRVLRSTIDVMFVSRLISSLAVERGVPLFKCFVDLKKAYDKVDRDVLWRVLERRGFPPRFLRLIQGLLIGSTAKVRINGKLSEEFKLERGLKQGSVFSPLLFNLFFGAIVQEVCRRLNREGLRLKMRLNGNIFNLSQYDSIRNCIDVMLTELLFADDAELVAESEIDLQRMVDVFAEVCDAFGQEISIKKTEVLVVSRSNNVVVPNITIKGEVLKVVSNFKYVGGIENSIGTMTDEMKTRRGRMGAAYSSLAVRVFDNKNVRVTSRLDLFNAVVITNGLYGCATWIVSRAELDKLESQQFRLLRRMFGFNKKDWVSYADLIARIRSLGSVFCPIEGRVRFRRLQYLGHVERMGDHRLPKQALHSTLIAGSRRRGGQYLSHRACVKEDLKLFGIDEKEWQVLCLDRFEWRKSLDKGLKTFITEWENRRENSRLSRKQREAEIAGADNAVIRPKKLRSPICFSVEEFSAIEEAEKAGKICLGRGHDQQLGKRKGNVKSVAVSRTSRLLSAVKKLEKAEGRNANLCGVCYSDDGQMVSCDMCYQWFHYACVEYEDNRNYNFLCNSCGNERTKKRTGIKKGCFEELCRFCYNWFPTNKLCSCLDNSILS
jgi:endonuclease/exonuclease/phosphatase family metal-dependent hydrolase